MSKAKKIILFIVCIITIICLLTVSVSAEERYSYIDVDVSKVQIKYQGSSGIDLTKWTTLSPINLNSPNGGTFQGTIFSSSQVVPNALQWNINTYFTNLQFKKNIEYHLRCYYVLPWDKLFTDDYFNLYTIQFKICDSSTRDVRYIVDNSKALNSSGWIKKTVKGGVNSADFGFFPIDFKFIPSSDFKGFFNTFIAFNLVDPPYSGGYFGFSDFVISYPYDSSADIINNQNENTDKIIENQNENADKEIQAEKDLYEQEKQEAEQSGDDSVDGALSAMPNDSDGIIDSFGSFIGTMLHTNTDCTIDFPALKTPAIGGLPSYTLSEKQPVNFNEFEEVIPKSILLIVRALLTIALIIFCYKELYSTIQYVVSLKKGGGD